MINRMFYACLLLFLYAASCSPVSRGADPEYGRRGPSPQTGSGSSSNAAFDPLEQVTSSFPQSVKLTQSKRILEFCPDETCHGFVGSADVSIATMKDFAYLYLYFFSDYTYLPEWR